MVTNNTVKGLQQRIVKALETGQDPAPILKELAQLRAKIAAEAEIVRNRKFFRGKMSTKVNILRREMVTYRYFSPYRNV